MLRDSCSDWESLLRPCSCGLTIFQTTANCTSELEWVCLGKQRRVCDELVGGVEPTHTHKHTLLPLPHCVYSGSPSCGAQHGSRVCTAATLARPRRMRPPLWSPRHQRHEPVCSPKHERHLALCPQPSLTLMRAAKEKEGVCVCLCVFSLMPQLPDLETVYTYLRCCSPVFPTSLRWFVFLKSVERSLSLERSFLLTF